MFFLCVLQYFSTWSSRSLTQISTTILFCHLLNCSVGKPSFIAPESFVLQLILTKYSHYYLLGHSNSRSFTVFLFFFLGASCYFSFSDDWNSALVAWVSQVTAKPQKGTAEQVEWILTQCIPSSWSRTMNLMSSVAGLLTANSVDLPIPLGQNWQCWFLETMVRDDLCMSLLTLLSCHLPWEKPAPSRMVSKWKQGDMNSGPWPNLSKLTHRSMNEKSKCLFWTTDFEIDCHRESWQHTHIKSLINMTNMSSNRLLVTQWCIENKHLPSPQTSLYSSSLSALVHPWSLGGLRKPANVDWKISGASFSSQEDPHFNLCPRGFPRLVSGPGPVLKIAILQTLSQWGQEHLGPFCLWII